MPTVLQEGPFRVFFYSNEGTEPPHVHIESGENRAKFWLIPIELVWNDGFRTGELKTIETLLSANLNDILGRWNEHFNL